MHKKLLITYIALVILTFSGALLAGLTLNKSIVIAIVIITVVKFLTVAFEFMELKTAHNFWKVLLTFYAIIISTIIMILL
jgi:hypothetical protein